MVSIIIPCFNGEKFIKRCFKCILEQTYKNIEVILINDGSTDNSENIIEREKENFEKEKIKFIYAYQENRGSGGAINAGLKLVTGKYLTLLDIDDYIMPTSIEEKVKFLENNNEYDIVRTNGYYVTENNINDQSKLFVISESEKENNKIFDALIQAKTNNWAGSYMIRTYKLFDFYKDRNIIESKYGQNLQLLLPLSYRAKAGFIDKPLMKYIKQENSLSQLQGDINLEIKNLLGYKKIREELINIILDGEEKKKYLNILEISYARYFMNFAFYRNDNLILKDNYQKLKKLKANDIDDKILYYNNTNKIIGIIFRVIKKLTARRKV